MVISCSSCQKEEKNACWLDIGFTLFCSVFYFVVIYAYFSTKCVLPKFRVHTQNAFSQSEYVLDCLKQFCTSYEPFWKILLLVYFGPFLIIFDNFRQICLVLEHFIPCQTILGQKMHYIRQYQTLLYHVGLFWTTLGKIRTTLDNF